MSENERQQRLIERVQEDERLRGDLPDDAAKILVEWASKRVAAAASDPARPDAEVEAEVQTIRAAARAAARAGQGEPQRLLALAETELAQRTGAPVGANLAAAVGTGAARARPQAPSPVPSEPPTGASQPSAPSQAQQPRAEQQPVPFWRRRNWFVDFLNHIRGGR